MTRGAWVLRKIGRQIWFRAALFSLLAILLALAAAFLAPLLPHKFSGNIGQDSVDNILQIVASSMLAVTTFSLTAMVSAYSSATTLATPRATQLMMQDTTSQNALSTFLGAFLFAIVGIVALSTGIYGEQGRTILFIGTIAVIVAIAATLLRWIAHLAAFGRMSDVIDRVERAAARSMAALAGDPHSGACPAATPPAGAVRIMARKTGYVTHVDVPALNRVAKAGGLTIHVAAIPGAMVHPARAILHVEGGVDDAVRATLADAFTVERHRGFDADPRLGMIALGEIGSRALAPATNDPGTAIEVMAAIQRVFLELLSADAPVADCRYAHVHMPRPSLRELAVDAFRPLIRDGGTEAEVAMRLQKTLFALAAVAGPDASIFTDLADRALHRALEGMGDEHEAEELRRLAESCRR